MIAGIVIGTAGAAVGMASGTAAATSTAATLADRGFYAQSIAIDEEIAGRTGPLYVVDEGAAADALHAAEQTVMAWAAYLGRKGEVDSAVALYRTVTAPALAKAGARRAGSAAGQDLHRGCRAGAVR